MRMVYTVTMASQGDTGLPAALEVAWGRRRRSTKGPKPGLSLERIVAAAVEIASSEGLIGVSMARVAERLGSSTMSLYRYVTAKDELLALMVDAVAGTPPPPGGPREGWRAGLGRWAWAYHNRMREHPWALQVPITGPPITPNQVAWFEDALWSLRGTRLSEEEKASVVLLLSGYVRSQATLNADLAGAGATTDAAMAGYARLLATLTSADEFPAIYALLSAGVFDKADPPEKEFSFGLERILDGVDTLVRSRRGHRV
jgi:AcrR family transcriptional regulator